MTQQKHLKALIRARMAKTGERYAAARSRIVSAAPQPSLTAHTIIHAHDRHCMTAVFTPDDAHIISGGFGGQARIWTVDGAPAGELVGHGSSVNVVRVSHDGTLAVTASSDRTVRLWDLPGRLQLAQLGKHAKQVTALDIDASGTHAWSGGHDGKVRTYDLSTGAEVGAVDVGSRITGVAAHPRNPSVAVASAEGGITIRDADGSVRVTLDPGDLAFSVVWSSDGAFLINAGPTGATVWAADEWEEVRSLQAGGSGVFPVAIAPDGRRVAVGWDHHVGLWAADEEQPGVVVDGLPKGVYGLSFSHDGSSLAMAAADGRVRTWAVG